MNEPMNKHTSFKIGGNADIYVKVQNIDDVIYLKKYTNENNIPLTIIGNGSNVLVKDNGIRGITATIDFDNISIEENEIVNVEAGVKLGMLAVTLQKNGIEGFEFAAGIPGTIGGAIRMNAGAYGKEFKDIVDSITYLSENNEIVKIKNEEALFKYRNSRFANNKEIILSATLHLQKGNSEQIKEKMNELMTLRKEKQPIDMPNAGSTFKRGTDFITAVLIDEAGLKGYKIGGAQVSTKHAGFIVNTGNAKAEDVLKLVEYVKKVVYEKFNKNIELEIEVIGE
jgi:UDP-N-acetylmuramate dehydrogenase